MLWRRTRSFEFLCYSTTVTLLLLFPLGAVSLSSSCKVWTRRIQSQPTNVTNALSVVFDISQSSSSLSSFDVEYQEKPLLEALRVCGSCERPDLALEIWRQFPTSEACRMMTVSVLGANNQLDQALELLDNASHVGSYTAAIAACGKAKDWERALQVYHKAVERGLITTMACNALFTVLSQRRQGQIALNVLNTMPCKPDRLTYQHIMNALSKSGMTEEAYQILEQLAHGKDGVQPSDVMYDMLIAACYKNNDLERLQKVKRLKYPEGETDGLEAQFQHWTGLKKVGKGKDAYWEIATIEISGSERIVVGVHPHRNPAKNGIQLEFYESPQNGDLNPFRRHKLGYLLMQNTEHRSCLLGMFLEGQRRKQGISKVCLAFWFWLCLEANVTPKTGIINKPLLALLLEDRFGMEPQGGVPVELAHDPDDPDFVQLYAPSRKNLRGVFSPWDVQAQKLRLLKEPPKNRGRMITVKAPYRMDPNRIVELADKVREILPESAIDCRLKTLEDFQSLFFGGKAQLR